MSHLASSLGKSIQERRPRKSRKPSTPLARAVIESLEHRTLLTTGTGLAATYYDNQDYTGVAVTQVNPTIDFTWASGATPVSGIANDNVYSTRWSGRIQAVEGGLYTFRTYSDDGVRLWITDGNAQSPTPVISNLTSHSPTYNTGTISLEAGKQYIITLEYYNSGGSGRMLLEWQRPGPGTFVTVPTAQLYRPMSSSGIGLPASYYESNDLTGTPVKRVDPEIKMNYTSGVAPITGLSTDNTYSVAWEGQIETIEAATASLPYLFRTVADGGMRVYLAESNATSWGTAIIDTWSQADNNTPVTTTSASTTFLQQMQANRKYKIRVEYRNLSGAGQVELQWHRPSDAAGVYTSVQTSQLYGPEMVLNPSFETPYTTSGVNQGVAQNWSAPYPKGTMTFGETTVGANVHGGTSAQVINTGTTLPDSPYLNASVVLQPGRVYEMSAWVRSDTPGGVDLELTSRKQYPPYNPYYNNARVRVGPGWQKVTTRGGISDNTATNVLVGIWMYSQGSVYVDDFSVTDVTESVLSQPVNSTPVPSSYMGQHFNLDYYHTQAVKDSIFAQTNLNFVRFNFYNFTWGSLQPNAGPTGWNQTMINNAKQILTDWRDANPNMKFVWTLGTPATWAVPAGSATSRFGAPLSSNSPASITDWNNYLIKMRTEFGSYVDYWEVWNEVDLLGSPVFYSGPMSSTPDQTGLVQLTEAADQILTDPAYGGDAGDKILGPNFTSTRGLNAFLAAGGGKYLDAVSFHHYLLESTHTPEYSLPTNQQAFESVMDNYGIGHLPLWNTEGATNTGDVTNNAVGQIARMAIVQWTLGISNFNWYAWDIPGHGRLTSGTGTNQTNVMNYNVLTPNGLAWASVSKWLTGATVTNRTVQGDGTWIVELTRPGGYTGRILWNPGGSGSFTVPASWDALRRRYLDGSSDAFSGGTLSVSGTPVLVEGKVLTSRWALDNNANDAKGAHNGTPLNSPTYTTGRVGSHSMQFNGTNQAVSAGTWDLGNQFTISAWINLNAAATNIQTIFANKTGGNYTGFAFYVNTYQTGDRKLIFETNNGTVGGTGAAIASSGVGAVPAGQWVHVAAVVDRSTSTARLYVNGADVTVASTIRNDFATNQANYIGRFGSANYYFTGGLDDVRFYGSKLTDDDVSSLLSAT